MTHKIVKEDGGVHETDDAEVVGDSSTSTLRDPDADATKSALSLGHWGYIPPSIARVLNRTN